MPTASTILAGRGLAQVSLTTRDLPRAIAFYRDVLGLPFLFEAGAMAFFDLAGVRLMIGLDADASKPLGGSILYFDDPQIDRTGERLEALGVRFLGPAATVQRTETHDLKLREFRDPDGNVLALMGKVARR